MPSAVALTGTPGTGKSSVARALAPRFRSVEVGDLAIALGAGRPRAGGVEVDLRLLRLRLTRSKALNGIDLVVGHLAHLLPVRDVIMLRCRPTELERRARHARRGSPAERRENFVAEATDVILLEAMRPGRRVWEVDTTGRTVPEVARAVARRLRHRGASDYGSVDWLADRRVTAHLLDPPR